MKYISVLDENGFITGTKIDKEVSSEMIGKPIVNFYGDTYILYGYYDLEDNGCLVNDIFISNEEGLNVITEKYSKLLNLIASKKNDDLLDLRLPNRDEPPYLRFFESLIKEFDASFIFKEVETSDKEIIETINELSFYLEAFFLINVSNVDNKKNPNWEKYHALKKTTLAMMNLIKYENIIYGEGEENFELVNDMMSLINGTIYSLHVPNKDYFNKDDNYFKG